MGDSGSVEPGGYYSGDSQAGSRIAEDYAGTSDVDFRLIWGLKNAADSTIVVVTTCGLKFRIGYSCCEQAASRWQVCTRQGGTQRGDGLDDEIIGSHKMGRCRPRNSPKPFSEFAVHRDVR